MRELLYLYFSFSNDWNAYEKEASCVTHRLLGIGHMFLVACMNNHSIG